MNVKEYAQKLFDELENLKKQMKEIQPLQEKVQYYTTTYPSLYISTVMSPPEGIKPTIDNIKNHVKVELKESYTAKKELETKMETITTKIMLIENQINLLNFLNEENKNK